MKKSTSLWVTLGLIPMLTVSLAACGGNDNEENEGNGEEAGGENEDFEDFEVEAEEGAELLMWSDGDEQLEWAEEMASRFEEEHGIPVQVEEVTQEDAPERLATDGPSGQAADVFGSTHDRIGRAISAGLVIENFWPEEYEEDYLEAAIEATSFDDVLYGYPTGIETYALFYNNDLVDEEPESMDELIEQASELTDDDGQYGFMMEPQNFYFNYAFIGGYGGYVFGEDNTDVNDVGLNNEGAVEGVELLVDMRDNILDDIAAEDLTDDVKTALFEEGSLAFEIDGPWAVRGYEDAGVDFTVIPLPELSNGEVPTSFSGTRGYYVNSYSDYPDAASLLAQFLSSEESLEAAYEITGQLPPHIGLGESEVIQEDERASAFLEQAEYAIPMPNVPEMPLVWEPMEAAVVDIWNNDADVQEALDQAVLTIENAIEEQQQ